MFVSTFVSTAGDFIGAQTLSEEALITREDFLGEWHPAVAETLNTLAGYVMTVKKGVVKFLTVVSLDLKIHLDMYVV